MKLASVPAGVKLLLDEFPTHIEVVRLVVAEDLRGRGLGTKTMRAVQRFGRAIRLTAVPEAGKKSALHRFYKKLGFRPVHKNSIGETVFHWTPEPR